VVLLLSLILSEWKIVERYLNALTEAYVMDFHYDALSRKCHIPVAIKWFGGEHF
jgi:hypothetical protein